MTKVPVNCDICVFTVIVADQDHDCMNVRKRQMGWGWQGEKIKRKFLKTELNFQCLRIYWVQWHNIHWPDWQYFNIQG